MIIWSIFARNAAKIASKKIVVKIVSSVKKAVIDGLNQVNFVTDVKNAKSAAKGETKITANCAKLAVITILVKNILSVNAIT